MKITDELLDYIGILARLDISDQEREKTKQEINKIVEYMDILNELDTEDIEAMSHAFPVKNVFREDVVTNGDEHEKTLKNAPDQKDNMFAVPKTFG